MKHLSNNICNFNQERCWILFCMLMIFIKSVNGDCNDHCYWTSWGSWGSCSQPCGDGIQSRTRLNAVVLYDYGCLSECHLSGIETETKKCNIVCNNGISYSSNGKEMYWHIVFRGVSGRKGGLNNIYSLWTGSSTANENNREAKRIGSSSSSHFKSAEVNQWDTLNFFKIKLSAYLGGHEQVSFTFKSSGTNKNSWLSKNGLIESSQNIGTYNYFSVQGHSSDQRRFFINERYGGCNSDYGWFVVCERQTCPWTSTSPLPNIKYSPYSYALNYHQATDADEMAIHFYKECPKITDCIHVRCTTEEDGTCFKCRDALLFKLDAQNKICSRKCSWENRWCWPGTCQDEYAYNCQCYEGFSRIYTSDQAVCQLDVNHMVPVKSSLPKRDTITWTSCHPDPDLPFNCLPLNGKSTATLFPHISTCQMRIHDSNGDSLYSKTNGTSHCDNQADFYGNIQVSTITTSVVMDYIIQVSGIQVPSFIDPGGYSFGITDAELLVILKKTDDTETHLGVKILKSDATSASPKSLFSEDNISIINNRALTNGDRLCLRFGAKGGGHLTSIKEDSNHTIYNSYNKKEKIKDLCYIFDDSKPQHCMETRPCSSEPLFVSSRITKNPVITVHFQGWEDPVPPGGSKNFASGIESYLVTLHHVKLSDTTTLEMDPTSILSLNGSTSVTMQLPDTDPALYAIVLEVKDIANNVQQARRFVLYDNSSKIHRSEDKRLYVTTASQNSTNEWQIHHQHPCVLWQGRYHNSKYIHFNPLLPIKPDHHGHITGIYEQNNGVLLVSGTKNVHGITEFQYALSKYDITTGTNVSVIAQTTLSNVEDEGVCIHVNPSDGDDYWFKVVAKDVVDNEYSESLNFHVDSSPPSIARIGIARDNHKQLFVHNATDLSMMNLQFETYDEHSGLYQVTWTFGTNFPKIQLGSGALGVKHVLSKSACPHDVYGCYCPSVGECQYRNFSVNLNSLINNNTHVGDHNRDYFFEITVTNNALLTNIAVVHVLVDESPPEAGVVLDGPEGAKDIDYTSSLNIEANWHGFIDHEGGIKLYKVGVAFQCMDTGNFTKYSEQVTVIDTTETSVSVTVHIPGKYFVTVVAYNNAMEPSKPSCSDGITIDTTRPVLSNVVLHNAKTIEHVTCSEGKAWVIDNNVRRLPYNGPCKTACTLNGTNEFLEILPFSNFSTANFNHLSKCETISKPFMYIPSDRLHLSWEVNDSESSISNVYVGIGSNRNSGAIPDRVDYELSSHNHTYHVRHLGLSSGSEFYLFIKVNNCAGITQTWNFGPVILDETTPTCDNVVPLKLNSSYVVIEWSMDHFSDPDQIEPISHVIYRIYNSLNVSTDWMLWSRLKNETCGDTYCIKYPLDHLQEHDADAQLPFTIEMHAFDIAGHFCTIISESFAIPSKHPSSTGIVVDLDPDRDIPTNRITDVEVTFNQYRYCVAWSGFSHNKDNITFYIGLGLLRGVPDVIDFHEVDDKGFYCQNVSKIKYLAKYFVIVKASSGGGTTIVSSDGFMVLNKSDIINKFNVYDGLGCADNSLVESLKPVTTNFTSVGMVQFKKSLHVGKAYEITINNTNCSFTCENAVLKTHNKSMVLIYPMTERPLCTVTVCDSRDTLISISLCEHDFNHTCSLQKISTHWSIQKEYRPLVTHFYVSIRPDRGEKVFTFIDETVKEVTGKESQTTLQIGSLNFGHYFIHISPCFGDICLPTIRSNGFWLDDSNVRSGKMRATLKSVNTLCSEYEITMESYYCSMEGSESDVFYRWSITKDSVGKQIESDWNTFAKNSNESSFYIRQCVPTRSYAHAKRYICVQGFCESGSSTTKCVPVETDIDMNTFPKDKIYDIDTSLPDFTNLNEYIHSRNIGRRLQLLHHNELDFSRSGVSLGAVVVGMGERNISWFLMKVKRHPLGICSRDSECIKESETVGGYVKFGRVHVSEGCVFICAVSNGSTDASNNFMRQPFHQCSDGVCIDDSSPTPGSVRIATEGSYITSADVLIIEWKYFHDTTGIASYHYFVGSFPEGQDVIQHTVIGTSTSAIIHNLNLTNGLQYYATVKAFNHAGMSTTAVSEAVIFDGTPPGTGTINVGNDFGTHSYVSGNTFDVHWNGFNDEQSGIKSVELGIGSKCHLPDVLPFRKVNGFLYSVEINGDFQDGHSYFVFLKVTNGAGLTTIVVSNEVFLDTSPPSGGIVRNGPSSNAVDIYFQTNTTHLHGHWTGFIDHQSGVQYYRVGVGNVKGFANVVPLSYVGLKTDMVWKLPLYSGKRYFITVEACNAAELCSNESSSGVKVDSSPPIPGRVHVGQKQMHSQYISHRKHIDLHWFGFIDPHSDIDHYEWCIGSTPGHCDVKPYTNALLLTYVASLRNMELPVNQKLYANVRAFNRAGLFSDRSSDYFLVDVTPPVVASVPQVFNSPLPFVSTGSKRLYDVSIINLKWQFEDPESFINRHRIYLKSNHNNDVPFEPVETTSENQITLNFNDKTWLISGDKYTAVVHACNAADLCTTAVSEEFTYDSTPPHLGHLHEPLSWTKNQSNYSLNITWSGFTDVESGVTRYYITAGERYSSQELSGDVKVLRHIGSSSDKQTVVIGLSKPLHVGGIVILSIWAENGVGLLSNISKISTKILSTDHEQKYGIMEIERYSCFTHYCNKDCTCAVVGKKCMNKEIANACKELNDSITDFNLNVAIGLNGTMGYTASSACLASHWTTSNKSLIERFEWSMGLLSMPYGDGIFDILNEKVWHDIGKRSSIIHCLRKGSTLLHNHRYVTYVRVWFSDYQYKTYESEAVLVDLTPPSIRRGGYIKNSDANCLENFHFLTKTDTVTACWSRVFIDSQSGLSTFQVSLGTSAGAADVLRQVDIGLRENITLHNLTLHPGTKYYVSVTAVNKLNLQTTLSSEEFVIDVDIPSTGIVFNTKHFKDETAQSSNHSFEASWMGFEDFHSSVAFFEVAVLDSSGVFITEFQNVGIKNTKLIKNLELKHGMSYVAVARAVDASGKHSDTGRSFPKVVDLTPPQGVKCKNFIVRINDIISHTSSREWSSSIPNGKEGLYKLSVSVHSDKHISPVIVETNCASDILKLIDTPHGYLEGSYNFHCLENTTLNVKLLFPDHRNVTTNATMNVRLMECNEVQHFDENTHKISILQIYPNVLAIEIGTYDYESGIQDLAIGVGSTKNGYQIQTLKQYSHIHYLHLPVSVPHKTPVYATVIATNHAGLRSYFSSNKLVIDLSSPVLKEAAGRMEYGMNKTVTLQVHWLASDDESGVKICFVYAGTSPGFGNVLQTQQSVSLNHFVSEPLHLAHGTRVFVSIRCVNHVTLSKQITLDPITIIHQPPDSKGKRIHFVSHGSKPYWESESKSITPTKSIVTFYWDQFDDFQDGSYYQYCLTKEEDVLYGWENVGKRNYGNFDERILKDDGNYTVLIRAVTDRGLISSTIETNISVNSLAPELTGSSCSATRISVKTVKLDCKDVFVTFPRFWPSFFLTVGSEPGYSDIIRRQTSTTTTYDIRVTSIVNRLYVYLTSVYITGQENVYRASVDIV